MKKKIGSKQDFVNKINTVSLSLRRNRLENINKQNPEMNVTVKLEKNNKIICMKK